jgi:hypothetical protein
VHVSQAQQSRAKQRWVGACLEGNFRASEKGWRVPKHLGHSYRVPHNAIEERHFNIDVNGRMHLHSALNLAPCQGKGSCQGCMYTTSHMKNYLRLISTHASRSAMLLDIRD